jgi:hypothetical protein
MMKKISFIVVIIVILATVVAFANSQEQNFGGCYTTTSESARIIVVNEKLNVREDPLESLQFYTEYSGTEAGAAGFGVDTTEVKNSLGKIKGASVSNVVSFRVKNVYYPENCTWDDCCKDGIGDTANGPYIGLAVDDIIELNDNWEKIFPRSIKNDLDGIVWISNFDDNICVIA